MSAPSFYPYLVSCVVDSVPDHAYKAEILVLTLQQFGLVPKHRIIVQFTDRVSPEIRNIFREMGVGVAIISPYLDGKHCNKLQQLPTLLSMDLSGIAGVFLLDLDIAFTAPLLPPFPEHVSAKIVDSAVPPIDDLFAIFKEAGVAQSPITESDWKNGKTLATNCNGGFLYIPTDKMKHISDNWRRFAEFLYVRPQLFSRSELTVHKDQVSFALALAATGTELFHLPTNYNFPLHNTRKPSSFINKKPIIALHYHNNLSPFGLINPAYKGEKLVDEAVEKVNRLIGSMETMHCFEHFKRGQAEADYQALPVLGEGNPLFDWLSSLPKKNLPKKLILHAGTPKTGTTSLQFFWNANREKLLEHGVFYPAPLPVTSYAPKHQFLVPALQQNNVEMMTESLRQLIEVQLGQFHTLLLSTEGIFNHWWDYSPAARAMLKTLNDFIPLEVWICFRKEEDFIRSLYVQNLKNPRLPGVSCYGKDLSLSQMLEDPWFARHLDYFGFTEECAALFGRDRLLILPYRKTVITDFMQALGLNASGFTSEPYEYNITPSAFAVKMLRFINRFNLAPARKNIAYALIQKVDRVIGRFSSPLTLKPNEASKISLLSYHSSRLLRQKL